MFARLAKWDGFGKIEKDYRIQTTWGAILSVIAALAVGSLLISAISDYLSPTVHTTLLVDSLRKERLDISIDIWFHHIPCSMISVDVMDVSGEQQHDVQHLLWKKRVDASGKAVAASVRENQLFTPKTPKPSTETDSTLDPERCESCYGAEAQSGDCCNSCQALRDAYAAKGWDQTSLKETVQCKREGWTPNAGISNEKGDSPDQGEGCNLYGTLTTAKVAGNFHMAPGRSFEQQHMHVHDLGAFRNAQFNLTHSIRSLSFGSAFPGATNPLDGHLRISESPNEMIQYFLKVVPTLFERADGHAIMSNQFSVTSHARSIDYARGQHGLPGAFFMFDFSAMMVHIQEEPKSFTHFLTHVCAVVGGVFTVAGMVDGCLFHGYHTVKAKIRLGKQA